MNIFKLIPKNKLFGSLFFISIAIILLASKSFIGDILGSNSKFSLYFSCVAPVTSSFLGTALATIIIMLLKFNTVSSTLILPKLGIPTIAATIYFGKKNKLALLIPIIAFAVFNLHPVGQQAWGYSLYWVIPVICYNYCDKSILARALGASFTAHAVGSVIWLYCFSLTPAQWLNLIPVVAYERLLVAAGMLASYYIIRHLYRVFLSLTQSNQAKDPA